jgi:hypothetical protein
LISPALPPEPASFRTVRDACEFFDLTPFDQLTGSVSIPWPRAREALHDLPPPSSVAAVRGVIVVLSSSLENHAKHKNCMNDNMTTQRNMNWKTK